MLARNAGHRAASLIALDPLAPRLLYRTRAMQSMQSNSRRHGPSNGLKSSRRASSISATSLNPAQLIARLDKQLQQYHVHSKDGLTPKEVQVFNEAIAALGTITDQTDLQRASHIWKTLRERDMTRFLGPIHHDMFSRFVVAACEEERDPKFPTELHRQVLPELALSAAAGGAAEGLQRYMLSLIRKNNPDAVVQLYERYWSLLQTRIPWTEEEHMESDQEPMVHSDAAAVSSAHSAAATLVRSDILLAAITAYAMQDSFSGALQASLRTVVRVPSNTIKPWLIELRDPKLTERVEQFVFRLELARLLARPSSLAKQFANFTRDHAIERLESLYQRIIDGLTGPNPWLTISPLATDPDRLVSVPDFTWSSFITGFMHCRRRDLVRKLWDVVLKLGIRPQVAMWTALIDGYAELKATDDAISTWDMMLAQGIKPDAMAYRALVYALHHSGRIDEAWSRFKTFQHVYPKMSPLPEESTVLVVYNTMLHGLLFHSREEQARALFDEMRSNGPKADIVTFNTFLRYYARNGHLKTLAEFLQMLGPSGLVGDVYTFSIVMSALMKIRNDAPKVVLNLMRRQGVQPNTATLTSIIDQQMRSQTIEGLRTALQLLEKMERNEVEGAPPNDITYTAILTGIYRGSWLERKFLEEHREAIWKRMEGQGIKLKRTTYNILINACLESDDPEGVHDALRYYRHMVDTGVFIANDTWFIMLQGLVRRKEWALANELVEDLRRSGLVPAGALSSLIQRIRERTSNNLKAGPASYF